MNNTFICLLLILALPAVVCGQGQVSKEPRQNADSLVKNVAPELFRPLISTDAINRYMEGDIDGYCHVSCDFVTLPGPLAPCRATLTFVATHGAPGISYAGNREIVFSYPQKACEWLSDTSAVWEGPITHGDTLTTHIEFAVLESGKNRLSIVLRDVHNTSMQIGWCLDESGILQYLVGGYYGQATDCAVLRTIFLSSDTISIRHPDQRNTAGFDTRLVISPPLHTGDTSLVTYYLTANETILDGVDFRLSTDQLRMVELPQSIDRTVSAGETVVLGVRVVPATVRNAQALNLTLEWGGDIGSRERRRQVIPCTAMFGDDGSLRYIYDGDLLNVAENHYSRSLPAAEGDGAWRSRLFRKDGPPPDSTDLR